MNWAALSKELYRLAATLAGAAVVYWLLHQTGLYVLTAGEAEALNTLILLLGSIYAVMFAFIIFVIWGQFTGVEDLSMRESSALKDLVRFSAYLDGDASHAIRRAVFDYAQSVVKFEWYALAARRRDQQTEKAFANLMNTVIRSVTARDANAADPIHHRVVEIAREAGQRRDERIAKSLTQIPPTLVRLVKSMALAPLLLVFVYPFRNWIVGLSCFILVAGVLFFADFVMMDTDNPFEGVCNVSSTPFSDLLL
jgi:hypothetical protein